MPPGSSHKWQIRIDTGGTFTDCIARAPDGTTHKTKVLSSSALRGLVTNIVADNRVRIAAKWQLPDDFVRGFTFQLLGHPASVAITGYNADSSTLTLAGPLPQEIAPGMHFEVQSPEEAPILAARLVTRTPMDRSLPDHAMRLATTRGTNALLERQGAATALFITAGFEDLLFIGNQQRPDIFSLAVTKPEPLCEAVVAVDERLNPDGSVLVPLDCASLSNKIQKLVQKGVVIAAVALLHSYKNPEHELKLAKFLLSNGFDHVSCSAEKTPFIKILNRCETAVTDAYLTPVISNYFSDIQSQIGDGKLHIMSSTGGLTQVDAFSAKDSLLSGPAGGVVGAARAAERSGAGKSIAFDMGGTSTDVSRYDGEYEYVFEHQVAQARLSAPALAIETIAAGGGSICWFDGANLRVGPHSAGADPGPACYGNGGPLTVTDVNLLLGYLDPNRFEIPIDKAAAQAAADALVKEVLDATPEDTTREILLLGFLEIATERMADAIRNISIRRGYDVREYALVAFGGAGGQHACQLAELLGIEQVMVPRDASLLSAFGLGNAVFERFAEKQILLSLTEAAPHIDTWIADLSDAAIAAVCQEGFRTPEVMIRRIIVELRFLGQDAALAIEYGAGGGLEKLFEARYRAVFGHWPADRQIELVSIRVVACSQVETAAEGRVTQPGSTAAAEKQRAYFDGNWQDVACFQRDELGESEVVGPALIFEDRSTTIVQSHWRAKMDAAGALVLRRTQKPGKQITSTQPEAVKLELFTNRFRAIVEDMGELLQRTAFSTNIKERLDFSCTLLDPQGRLLVNAPHMPVHLGAMGICVRRVREALEIVPGDVIITNHPGFGGSHLPDITLITPVFAEDQKLLGFVANRAHHAEIGGSRPGSMPPTATCLSEEGVVFPPMHLISAGVDQWEAVKLVFLQARFPTRALSENLADLNAGIAANMRGQTALHALAREHGTDQLIHYMGLIRTKAERAIRTALERIPDGAYRAEEFLDDGHKLAVEILIDKDTAVFDFTGSSGQHCGNLNATPAIVSSVIIYVLRLLVDEPLPLNEGLLAPIKIILPQGMLNPHFPTDPDKAPAVVGGNVETSQRLVDTLIKALGLAACSQGTMNNLLLGNQSFSYYETVCGGCGAGPGFAGCSAVHHHMTNTRITDVEILEHRYPVRVERFAVRRGSGGEGEYPGGDGVVREIVFLEPMALSILSQHRKEGPFGLMGGKPGLPGKQQIMRADGTVEPLGSVDGTEVRQDDRLVLETPGGGGYGSLP